jgi:hypothetical protein
MKREHIASRLPDTDLGQLAQALRTIAGRARQKPGAPGLPATPVTGPRGGITRGDY